VTGGLNKLFDTGGGGNGNMNAADIKADTAEEKAFIATVRELEGTAGNKGYDTWFGGRTDMKMTDMTIQQVHDEQTKRMNAGETTYNGLSSAAVGAGQFMTPLAQVKAMFASQGKEFDPTKVKFTKELQNQLILDLAKRKRGVDVSKPLTIADMKILGGEWASFTPQHGQTSRTAVESLRVYDENLGEARKAKPDPKPDPAGNLDDIPYTQEESNALLAAGTPEKYAEVMAKIKKRQAEALKAKQSNVGVPNSAPEISESYGVDQGKSFNFSIPGKGNYEAYKTATGFEIFRHGGLGALVGAKTRIDTKDGANSWAVAALMKAGKARQEAAKVTPPPKTDQAAAVAPASKPSIAASSASPQTGTPIMVTSAQVASASTASAGAAPTIINNYYGGGQQQGGVNGNGVVAGIDMNAAGLSAFQDLKIRTIS
jgi:hypothetical protein